MADTSGDLSGLQIDTDWKKQAQAEKRRLAEELKEKQAAPTPAAAPAERSAERAERKLPPASFDSLLRSVVTQALYYLGDLASPGGEPAVNLDLAKHHLDTLAVLEGKTHGNLDGQEKQTLDESLYEVRMRFVAVASRYIL